MWDFHCSLRGLVIVRSPVYSSREVASHGGFTMLVVEPLVFLGLCEVTGSQDQGAEGWCQ